MKRPASAFAVALSTSSPQTSVALFALDGACLWSGERFAPQAASGACAELLASGLAGLGLELAEARLFLADLGPGSFTGVRVGVVFAKTLAFANGAPCGGATAFDLIARRGTAYVPRKKGELFVRAPGEAPRTAELAPAGAVGYAGIDALEPPTYPHARNFGEFWPELATDDPAKLAPAYFAEPNISTPKRPYGARRG